MAPEKIILVDEVAVKALTDLDVEIATRLEEIGRTHGILAHLQPEIDARRHSSREASHRERLATSLAIVRPVHD